MVIAETNRLPVPRVRTEKRVRARATGQQGRLTFSVTLIRVLRLAALRGVHQPDYHKAIY